MVIPAAGLGSRLKSSVPKVLYPVNGRPMIEYLLNLHSSVVGSFILVVSPSCVATVRRRCLRYDLDIEYAVQETPSGMLDAVLAPLELIQKRRPQGIWVTWCDQIAVHPETVATLFRESTQFPQTAVIFPTITKPEPYVHFARDAHGAIVGVLHAREGDAMPEIGESDIGLFRLSSEAYLEHLPAYSRGAPLSKVTHERNFLPFIPWLSGRAAVRTYPISNEIESVGVNDMADLEKIEAYLRHAS
jgi:bifunctional UDP-N-acetylglucosamine pyrophosphorylase/glucosamine-1-phosphate N-acetyltransferase